jgi:hypothetical protein
VEYLFSDHDLHAVLEGQREQVMQAINSADASDVSGRAAEEVADEFVRQFQVIPPELTEGAISVEVEEAQVDVSRDPNRHFFDGGPHYAPGIRAKYYVPFTGDPELLRCRPSTYSTMLPAVDKIDGQELVLCYERGDTNVTATKAQFERDLSHIKQYLGWWVWTDSRTFNACLPPMALQHVAARQTRVREMRQGADSLGVPIRRAIQVSHATSSARRQRRDERVVETYDVALTFAGEDREYVEQVAEGLRDAGVSVFYDLFEQARLWGKNLVDHLADIYQRRSRYVVMFISSHYVQKAWPTHERQHAQARALLAKGEYILPARFDDTDVPGMTATVGHVDLRRTTPAELTSLILTKLGRAG